jgi:ATP-dependent protease ClpP protease subunit
MSISALVDFNADIINRKIFINGLITETSAKAFEVAITLLEYISKENDITIELSSCGGIVSEALLICKRIKKSPCKIIVNCGVEIMSSGVLICAAGAYRTAYSDTIFMNHALSAELPFNKLNDQINSVNWLRTSEKHINSYLAERTTTPAKIWKKLGNKDDYFFDAEEALKLGLIDEIIK